MTEALFASATAAAAAVRRREISSRELTELLLDRIAAANPALNAVVEVRAEQALEEAAAADRAIASGVEGGPLHGVPMTIKDSVHAAGFHTTWGNPAFRDYVASEDAVVVRRLRQAGAILVGKTNVAFMLADFAQTRNDLFGVTNNPWDLTRTPGGSTGGGAAALAAGMTFLEYGSDLVGSVRIPAASCGVYGLKPSVGIVPLSGFQPPGAPSGPSDMTYMSAVGPLARAASDLRTAIEVTAGPDEPAAHAYTWHLARAATTRLADLRVGVVLDHPSAPVSSELATPLAGAIDALARAGATVIEGWPAGIEPDACHESFGFHVGLFFAFQQPGGEDASLAAFVEQEHRRMAARAAWADYFRDVDVFVCPTNVTPAIPHDDRPFESRTIRTPEGDQPYTNQVFWIAQPALPGLPVVAAPVGRTAGGLPVGIQIVGPLYADDAPITVAELLADVVGGYEPPPG